MKLNEKMILTAVIGATLITILYALSLSRKINKIKVKNQKVDEISSHIKEGAMAFLKREYMILIPFIIGMGIILWLLGYIPALKTAEGIGYQAAISFVIGGFFSGLAGFIGMRSAIKANARTTEAAETTGMSAALKIAFSGGSVLGLTVVGLGLLGLTSLFFLFSFFFSPSKAVHIISGYGMGASMIALFARVGGGIYTKAADVGADLVGKLEIGIPEDDPRNPAVIADNVGDNVGDIAGMGSDLCESYVGAIISALAIGITTTINNNTSFTTLFPLALAGVGVLAAVLSVIFIRWRTWQHPQRALNMATIVAEIVVALAALGIAYLMFKTLKPAFAIITGLLVGYFLGKIAEYYTSEEYRHVQEIAIQSETGHATNIISGFGIGMQSTALTIAVLLIGVSISFAFSGNYGIALAAVGMLSTAGITISVDGYGPIADNAGGISAMAGLDVNVRQITDKLDSVGNTTAAIGKGFCIGSATLTSLALFVAYSGSAGLTIQGINVIQPVVIIGLLVGAMLPYFFTSLTLKSVGRAANHMIEEVRRQYLNDPGIMEGTSKPDYARCVDISTQAALKEMIIPGLIALFSPILTGILLGREALGGLLVGALASAIMLAVFMANAGGAWDNAKKYIEEGNHGGKGSQAHKAAITGDTVGDPFKDTAGPAMDILIKLMSIISLILAPILANPAFKPLLEFIFNR